MSEAKVWVFFYGSYMNLNVLREVDLVPERHERGRLDGFDIRIAPRANLVPSVENCVYGILATATHAELERLYTHSKVVLGETYLPEAVLVRTDRGDYRPALCYICPHMEPRPAEAAYVERIVAPARELAFPPHYVERLLAFHPDHSSR
jgi:cation transport regulator ChaC